MDRRSMLLGSLLTAAAAPSLAHAKDAPAPRAFKEAWAKAAADFRADLKGDNVVGGSVWFLNQGRLLGEEYYGYADLEAGRKVDANTIYHWASITKTFTAIGLMQLRDRGLVKLSDPVVKYLPEFAQVHDPYGKIEEVTLCTC